MRDIEKLMEKITDYWNGEIGNLLQILKEDGWEVEITDVGIGWVELEIHKNTEKLKLKLREELQYLCNDNYIRYYVLEVYSMESGKPLYTIEIGKLTEEEIQEECIEEEEEYFEEEYFEED